jgi:hypothetical protein
MRNKTNLGYWLILGSLLFSGCSSALQNRNEPSQIPSTTPALTRFALPTSYSSPTPFSTRLSTNIAGYIQKCAAIEAEPPESFVSPGVIILHNVDANGREHLFALNPVDNSLVSFTDRVGFSQEISPNGKRMAQEFIRPDGHVEDLRLLSAGGKIQGDFSVQGDWDDFIWLGDKLLLRKFDGKREDFYEIYTGQNYHLDTSNYGLYLGLLPKYNLNFTRAVFERVDQLNVIETVLLDIQNNTTLWEVISGGERNIQPQWSPDWTKFAVGTPNWADNGNFQLFIVDQDGQVQYKSNFVWPADAWDQKNIQQPTWSPNQRYIAYWLGDSLTIFDTSNEISTDYCLSAVEPVGGSIFWSPDSRQFVFDLNRKQDSGGAVLVDVNSGRAFHLPGYFVVGWMDPLP